jgi:hypothetical protein
MKNKLFTLLLLLLIVASCGTTKYVYLPGETKVEYRDTTIYRDSIQYTPVEVVKEIVPALDTLEMSTSLAEAKAYVDTTNRVLRGEIRNKKGITNEIHYKDRIVYRDSIDIKPYRVEVEKIVTKTKHPFYEPILWLFALLSIGYIGFKLVKRYLVKI